MCSSILNSDGPNTEPWGIPDTTGRYPDSLPSHIVAWVRLDL